MSLDSHQVVHSLLSFYRRRGADLTYLLGDPIFDKLPLEDKVEAVKIHAGTILNSTPESLNKDERSLVRGEVVSGALMGGLTAFGVGRAVLHNPVFAETVARNKALAAMAGGVIVAGAGAGYLLGKFKTDQLKDARLSVRNELQRTVANPTMENSLGVLSAGHLHARTSIGKANIIAKVMSKIDDVAQGPIKEVAEPLFKAQYHGFKKD